VTIPAAYSTALAARRIEVSAWVEIEGLPWAYGYRSATATVFGGRTAVKDRLLGIKPWIVKPPAGFDQRVDVLAATATIGVMTLEILDLDRTLTGVLGLGVGRTDNALSLASSMTAAATSLTVNETPDATAYPTTGGTIYVGRETIVYASRAGSVFTITSATDNRGMYGGTAAVHTASTVVTNYPRFLGQRKATVRHFLGTWADAQATDDGSVIRMIGIVTGCPQNSEKTGFALRVESIDRRVSGWVGNGQKKKLFDGQWKSTLRIGLPGVGGGTGVESSDDNLASNRDWLTPQPKDYERLRADSAGLAAWNDARGRDKATFVQVEDEILLVSFTTASHPPGAMEIIKSGCFGTPREQHSAGTEVKEVLPIAWSSDGSVDVKGELFFLPWISDHPIDIALQLILSTGTSTSTTNGVANGTNYTAGQTNYDSLPRAWGMGVPISWLDQTEIEQTRDLKIPGQRGAGVIVEPFELREFLTKEVYQPWGLFPVTKLQGLYSIRRLDPPMPLDTPTAITAAHLVEAPGFDANIAAVIGRVRYKYDRGLKGHATENFSEFTEAQALYEGVFGTVERDSGLMRARANRPAFEGAGLRFPGLAGGGGADAWALDQTGWWQTWFERPPPVVDVTVLWGQHTLEAGDLVTLTNTAIPDVTDGTIGVTAAPGVITKKKPNDADGTVEFLLLMMGIHSGQFRHVAPSALVTAWVGGTKTLTVDNDSYAADGDTDVAHFTVGDVIEVATADLATISGQATIVSITVGGSTTAIVLDVVPATHTPANTDILLFANAADVVEVQQVDIYAFMADDALAFGGYVPHRYVP